MFVTETLFCLSLGAGVLYGDSQLNNNIGSPDAALSTHTVVVMYCSWCNLLMNLSFPVLLILASQRIEDIIGWDLPSDTTKRGSLPSVVEYCILAWVAGNEDLTKRIILVFGGFSCFLSCSHIFLWNVLIKCNRAKMFWFNLQLTPARKLFFTWFSTISNYAVQFPSNLCNSHTDGLLIYVSLLSPRLSLRYSDCTVSTNGTAFLTG